MTNEHGRHTNESSQIIDEDGTPVIVVPTTARTRPNIGSYTTFNVRDLTGGKHPLRTKVGWRAVLIVALLVAILAGLIALSVIAFVVAVPVILGVAGALWVRGKLTKKNIGGPRGHNSMMTTS